MDEEAIDKHKEAGKITAQAREFGKGLLKPGASILEITKKVEAKIVELGGRPAFPVQISRNEIAAHYCASFEDELKLSEDDIVSLDVGVHVDGYVADSAVTVDLSKDNKNEKIIESSKAALDAAIKKVKAGVTLAEIGAEIEKTIGSLGFNPVKNLTGHGVGQYIVHGPPQIPNFDNGDDTQLEEGDVIAIEPFATDGAGMIHEKGDAEVYHLIGRKGVRGLITRQVLNEIQTYEGLPFAKRWLVEKFSMAKVNYAFKELENAGILKKYPPLPDRNDGLVSQAEHTVIVTKDGCEVITD